MGRGLFVSRVLRSVGVQNVAVSRRRITPAAPLALAIVVFFGTPSRITQQDLGSLLAQQPGVTERARAFFLASPFATLKTATFSPVRPIGSTIPMFRVHFDPDITGSIPRNNVAAFDWTGFDVSLDDEVFQIPVVNRAKKGDLLKRLPVALAPAEPVEPLKPVDTATLEAPPVPVEPNSDFDVAMPLQSEHPAIAEVAVPAGPRADVAGTMLEPAGTEKIPSWNMYRVSRLLFGTDEDILPPSAFEHRAPVNLAALPGAAAEIGSVAPKGLVTGEENRPKSPAEQFKLVGAPRAKAEKCLAEAIYFESRGEVERGQVAVAQVVVNRALSGYYPADVCGVVYQNAHRHLACQFTFACDGIPDRITEPAMWEQAKRIARDMLDGKIWLSEVGKATHYHAFWVRPVWVREMRTIQRIGVHTFYRPRKWEDG
jgi:spore germination cell wall hydrolase CwlJ-like protein